MTDYYSMLKSWQEMVRVLDGIPDPRLRKLYRDSLVLKAIDEWGFNPDTLKQESIRPEMVLDDWEKRLLERIKVMQEYGFDPVTKEEKEAEERKAKLAMYQFVRSGGTLADIPEDLRTEYNVDLYLEAVKKVYDV